MNRIKRYVIFAITLAACALSFQSQGYYKLSEYNFGAASVLPVYFHKNQKYVILSREAHGRDRGTYDDFGGKRDPGENHPLITAAREFFEEAILQYTLKTTLPLIRKYINVDTGNTEYIIANEKNVTYITRFDKHVRQFVSNFYTARKKVSQHHLREKDRIALVKYDTIKKVINAYPRKNSGLTVEGFVVAQDGKTLQRQQIPLRPFFVKKLRPFFMDKPYQQGCNQKIRLYDQIKPENSFRGLLRWWKCR